MIRQLLLTERKIAAIRTAGAGGTLPLVNRREKLRGGVRKYGKQGWTE